MSTPSGPASLARLGQDLASLGVLCDLDGSLAPILSNPEDAELIEGARATLRDLASRAGLVALVSGRGIDDLMRIVALPELTYAGNHGMEFRRPGQDPAPALEAALYRPRIAAFAEEWSAALGERGITVEDTGVTLSLHYRRAGDPAGAKVLPHHGGRRGSSGCGPRPDAGPDDLGDPPADRHRQGHRGARASD